MTLKDRRNYALAEHYLRRALEGVLTIGSHILSRLPAKTKDYRQIILSLGEYKIVPVEFAEKNKRLQVTETGLSIFTGRSLWKNYTR